MLNLTENDYINAEKIFNEFYEKKMKETMSIEVNYQDPTPIKISTITLTGQIGDYVMGKYLYDRLSINPDIIYLECGKKHKGNKNKKKAKYSKKEQNGKLDKRKLGRGKPLSNQISIGMKGIEEHKNPVCIKIFKNGKIQLTGCKSIREGYQLYEKLYNYILNVPRTLYLGEKKYYITPVKNIIPPNNIQLDSEMINASYNLNFEIEQKVLYDLFIEKYNNSEIFVTYDACVSSPAVRCYLVNMSVYDERKKKDKQPSCFIYRSGSVNIIVWKEEMLINAYNFINTFIRENFDKIVSRHIDL